MNLPGCMMPDGADPCKEYQELRAELDAAQVAINKSRTEACNLQGALAKSKREAEAAHANLLQASFDFGGLAQTNDDISAELHSLSAELAAAQESLRLANKEIFDLKTGMEQLKRDFSVESASLDRVRAELEVTRKARDALPVSHKHVEGLLSDAQRKLEAVKKENEAMRALLVHARRIVHVCAYEDELGQGDIGFSRMLLPKIDAAIAQPPTE